MTPLKKQFILWEKFTRYLIVHLIHWKCSTCSYINEKLFSFC